MKEAGRHGDRSVAMFFMGAVLFSPPLLAVFSAPTMIFGFPLLYFYLFVAWFALICLIAINGRSSQSRPRPRIDAGADRRARKEG